MSFFTLIGFQHHPFTAEDLVRATNVKNPYTKIGARVLSNCFNICLAPKQNLFKEGAEGVYVDKNGFAYVLAFRHTKLSLSLSCKMEAGPEEFSLSFRKEKDTWWWGLMTSSTRRPIIVSAQLLEVPSLTISGPISKRMRA